MTDSSPPVDADALLRLSGDGRVPFVLALLSWLLLMVPMFAAGPLVLDEHGSYWIVDADVPGTMLRRSLNHAAIPPLSSWTQWFALKLLGKSEWAFRLPSALCGLVGIGVCYLAGRDLRDPRTGGIAALLLAWHPEAMDEVRIARCYGLVLLLGGMVFWSAVRWRRQPESWGWTITWSLAAAALLWTHYTSALLVMFSGIAVAWSCLQRGELHLRTLLRLAAAAGLAIGLCLPLVPAVQRLQEWGPLLNYSGGSAGLAGVFGPWWWVGLPAGLSVAFFVGRVFADKGTSSAPGLKKTETSDRTMSRRANGASPSATGLAFVCGVVPLLILFWLSSGETSSLANPRYRVAYAPAGACLFALLLSAFGHRQGAHAGMVALLTAAWVCSPIAPWQTGRLGAAADREWRELNAVLARESKPGEPIVVQSGLTEGFLVPILADDPDFMEYVACRVGRFYVETSHPRLALPFLWDPRTGIGDFYRARLDDWRRGSGSFWVAAATDTDLNRNSLAGIQGIATAAGYDVVATQTWSNAVLIHFQVRAETGP